jgi:4-amino-4-deoxy-L-arabinose transferase-like glycosyltransferase
MTRQALGQADRILLVNATPPRPRILLLLTAGGIALASWLLLLVTSPCLALVWDEGDTIARAEVLARGFSGAESPADKLDALKHDWPYTIVREGHPPLAGYLIAIGHALAPSWLGPITAFRLGPITFFALAVGAMFYRLAGDYSLWSMSLIAVAALLTMPRVFAHAHYATLDGPLTAAWILSWAAFSPAASRWRCVPLLGLMLGLAFSAKLTGWLAPVPLIAWGILYRDRRALAAVSVSVPIALAVFVALNPPLWDSPIEGLRTFFSLHLHRGDQASLNITTQFFGRLYNLDHPLPWYNTLMWNAITVSPMLVLFGCLGIYGTASRWRADRAGMLLVLSWATLIVARALPWAPPHDAERLILPSFAFFAALVGVGFGRALYRESLLAQDKIVAQGWAKVALVLTFGAATFDSIAYFPFGLSFYNRLVGGLRGAVSLGMEPTYYWDSLDAKALRWLNEHTAAGETIAFEAAPPKNMELLHRFGMLTPLVSEPAQARWYVIQRRPSALLPHDWWLVEHAEPAFERALGGVPLLDIYSGQEYRRAVQATGKTAVPRGSGQTRD